MSIFGDLERIAGDLYPYRWPISAAVLLVIAAVLVAAYPRGWHRTIGRHRKAAVLIAVVVLAVAIPLGTYTLSPLWTRTELNEADPLLVAQAVPADTSATAVPAAGGAFQPRVASTGVFTGADDFHFGRGQVQLIETAPGSYTVRFEDFSVRNGPDLFVYLSPSADGYADGALNLGDLKATDGAFNYEIPAGTDLAHFRSVIVWCKQFTVLFATAPLVTT